MPCTRTWIPLRSIHAGDDKRYLSMKLILNSKFKWKEPASYYRWRRNIDKQYIPKWRYTAKYVVMFLLMFFGIFVLGCLTSSNMNKTVLLSFISGILLCFGDWAMRFEKAYVWVLDDEIIYRFLNCHRHFQYDEIQTISIKHISENNENFDLLSIIINSGEKYAIAVDQKINKNQLMHFLDDKVKCDK